MKTTIFRAAALALLLAGCDQHGQQAPHPEGQAPDRATHADHPQAARDGHGQHEGRGRHWLAGDLEVSAAWSRAIPPAAPVAGGYLAIRNHGGEDDRLVEVRSDAAQRVEIHEVRHEDGMARMRPLPDGLPLPAGEAVELRPGGYHLMFIGPGDGFVAGRSVAATLVFERAGELAVEFEVRAIAAQSPAGGHEHH